MDRERHIYDPIGAIEQLEIDTVSKEDELFFCRELTSIFLTGTDKDSIYLISFFKKKIRKVFYQINYQNRQIIKPKQPIYLFTHKRVIPFLR